jgi:bacitracin transport system permease protein
MIFAKIIVLFLFGLIFCLSTAAVTIVCGSLIAEVGGLGYKLWLAVEMGIFITAGTLPLVVLVVFFSRTYIFSVLLCIFYSVLSLTAEAVRIFRRAKTLLRTGIRVDDCPQYS